MGAKIQKTIYIHRQGRQVFKNDLACLCIGRQVLRKIFYISFCNNGCLTIFVEKHFLSKFGFKKRLFCSIG